MRKGWKIIGFEDCLDKIVYTKKIQRKDFLQSGNFPIISQEQDFINGYWNESVDLFKIKKPVIIFGDHTQVLKYVPFDFVLGADGVKILQPKDEFVPKYFYYFLTHVDLKKLGYARHYRLLKEILVPLPPLLEQQHTITILDESFAAIAKAKENVGKNLANAREVFESYLHRIFEYKGEIWKGKKLEDICKKITDGEHLRPKVVPEGVPFLSAKNVLADDVVFSDCLFISSEDAEKFRKRCNPEKGDVLIVSRGGTVGRTCVIKSERLFCLLGSVILLKIERGISPFFIEYALKSPDIKNKLVNASEAAAQPAIYLRDIKVINIPCPTLSVQQSIVSKLDSLTAETKKLENIYKQKLADLDELKSCVLQKAFKEEL